MSPKFLARSTSVTGTRAVRTVAADLHRVVKAAVVDEDDLVAALDVLLFDVVHERRKRRGGVVHRNDEAEGRRHVQARARFFAGAAFAAPRTGSTLAVRFFVVLTASRLLRSASIRLTTRAGASTAVATISWPAIFASMIAFSPS